MHPVLRAALPHRLSQTPGLKSAMQNRAKRVAPILFAIGFAMSASAQPRFRGIPDRGRQQALCVEGHADAAGWPRPLPGVVLVGGSGPVDMDETIGPDKPLRDLAHGLAAQGIAVLRYDKRTHDHAALVVQDKHFDIDGEYTDDALAALKQLRATPGIDRDCPVPAGPQSGRGRSAAHRATELRHRGPDPDRRAGASAVRRNDPAIALPDPHRTGTGRRAA